MRGGSDAEHAYAIMCLRRNKIGGRRRSAGRACEGPGRGRRARVASIDASLIIMPRCFYYRWSKNDKRMKPRKRRHARMGNDGEMHKFHGIRLALFCQDA